MPYECFASDDGAPVLLVTNLAEGDTQAVCADHLADWGLAFLQSVTGQEWAPASATFTDPATDEPTDEPEGVDGPTTDGQPLTPELPPDLPPAEDDDQGDDDDGGQAAEDHAVRDADLRQELAGRSTG